MCIYVHWHLDINANKMHLIGASNLSRQIKKKTFVFWMVNIKIQTEVQLPNEAFQTITQIKEEPTQKSEEKSPLLHSPGFLDLDIAAQFLQHKLPSVVVDDEHTVFLVRTLVSFEYCHGRCRALEGELSFNFTFITGNYGSYCHCRIIPNLLYTCSHPSKRRLFNVRVEQQSYWDVR